DSQGRYEIRYHATEFHRAEKKRADLRVRVCNPDGREIATSPTVFNARTEETINVPLSGDVSRVRSEYERLVEELTPLLQDLTFAELTEDREHQDVAFLSGETSEDPQRITFLIQAHRLMKKTKIPAETYYGLFREGLPTQLPLLLAQSPD